MIRSWVPPAVESEIDAFESRVIHSDLAQVWADMSAWHAAHLTRHDHQVVNLNPATNMPGPRVSRLLGSSIGSRPSLGYPGAKYETGLEDADRIEMTASALLKRLTGARFVEYRVPSGSIANLYAFLATTKPGDTVMTLAPAAGGHATHQAVGAAGLCGLDIHPIPFSPTEMTVDAEAFALEAERLRPKLVVIGGSLVLRPFPVVRIAEVCASVGATLMFDAAHLSGLIAGGAHPDPLQQGADLMTSSTYKSFGGPPGGFLATNDPALAERIDLIAYPGLTANFDLARTAALGAACIDLLVHGRAYAGAMVANASALGQALAGAGLTVHGPATETHQVALLGAPHGGGHRAAQVLEKAGILASGIGLPVVPVPGDYNGIRLGTPEVTRWGMGDQAMAEIAGFVARALASHSPSALASEVIRFRSGFQELAFCER